MVVVVVVVAGSQGADPAADPTVEAGVQAGAEVTAATGGSAVALGPSPGQGVLMRVHRKIKCKTGIEVLDGPVVPVIAAMSRVSCADTLGAVLKPASNLT